MKIATLFSNRSDSVLTNPKEPSSSQNGSSQVWFYWAGTNHYSGRFRIFQTLDANPKGSVPTYYFGRFILYANTENWAGRVRATLNLPIPTVVKCITKTVTTERTAPNENQIILSWEATYCRPQRSWGKVIFSEACVRYQDQDQDQRKPPPDQRQALPPPAGPDNPHPPQCMLGDTGNKRAVRILLECNLVWSWFFFSGGSSISWRCQLLRWAWISPNVR